jgi:hypothetical protein
MCYNECSYFVQQDVQGRAFAYMGVYVAQFLRRQESITRN